jgi:hypothetical protein|tara:strand:- start:205 stop:309 length:105 start_codon:yes stop_codon:yes gene_type:complete
MAWGWLSQTVGAELLFSMDFVERFERFFGKVSFA